jgi:hypothetical protein
MKFGTAKIMDVHTSFIWLILFDEAFKYDDGAKSWGYVGTNTEPVHIEFCNFMWYHIFADYYIK